VPLNVFRLSRVTLNISRSSLLIYSRYTSSNRLRISKYAIFFYTLAIYLAKYVRVFPLCIGNGVEKGVSEYWKLNNLDIWEKRGGEKRGKKIKMNHTYPPPALRHVPLVFAGESIFAGVYSSVSSASSTVSWQSILSGVHTLSRRNRPITDWTFGCSIPPEKRKDITGMLKVPLGINRQWTISRAESFQRVVNLLKGKLTLQLSWRYILVTLLWKKSRRNFGSRLIFNS